MTKYQIAQLKFRNEEIWKMYQRGITVQKIADAYGLKSRQAIYNILRRDNRPFKKDAES